MSLTIDCGTCSLQDTPACGDCVVNFILSRPDESEQTASKDDAVVVEAAEYFALRRLQNAGLVPELRYEEEAAETA